MATENLPATGPQAAQFLGTSTTRQLKRLFHATRPKFFPASVLPVLAGTAWGYMLSGHLDSLAAALALLATVCVHAGANVLNDVGDDATGTDRRNESRIYPYTGGSRFIQAGIMSSGNMLRLGVALLSVAAVAGLWLTWLKGLNILWFGIAGLALATLYSLGPLRLSALGLGEAAVGAGFGVLPVAGAAWLQSGSIDIDVVLFSLPISAWVIAILLINEVPDIPADAATGKRTLAVRLHYRGTAILYLALHILALAAAFSLALRGALPAIAPLIPAVLLALAWRAGRTIRDAMQDRPAMTRAIEITLAIHTIGSLWLMACVLYAAIAR